MSVKQGIHKLSCERTNMSAKCKMVMNCSKNFMAVKTNMTAKWGIFKRTYMWVNRYDSQMSNIWDCHLTLYGH